MSTLLPPQNKSGANFDNGGADNRCDVEYLELCMRRYPQARHRAMLSILPGLGQIRNGEIGKGILFLTVTAFNFLLVTAVIGSGALTKALSSMATAFHRQPNFELAAPILSVVNSPALFIYIGLVGLFVAYAMRDAYDRCVRIVRDKQEPKKYALTLPEATSGSYLAHFAIMAAFALLVVFFITPETVKPQVVEIQLQAPDKPKPPAPKPKAPAPAPRPKAIEPKPVVVEKPVVKPVVKPEPIKPMPIAVATPTKEPTPFTAAPPIAAAPPADPTPGPAGGGGGTGTGTGDGDGTGGGEVDMGPWMREMQRKIKRAWFPPKGNESKRIKVTFKVSKDGTVHKVKLISSSGVSIADDAATQAINDAAPFANLPDGVGDEIDINFTFDYNVFGRGR